MLGVTFGSKHSYNDWGIWLEDTHINPPLPKRYIVDVPARNGLLDLTPELTPTIRFENRTLTFNFRVKAGDWSTLVSQIYGDIHGRTLDVVSDLDPNWHWHGCVTVDDFSSDERTGVLVITVDADPFKLSNTENSYTVNGNGTITCVVDRMEISPAFELTAPTTVIYGDSSYAIESTATTEKTLSGDIVSFIDGAENPAVDLTADIEATQDLHGYDYPWVGGAGKNKFKASISTQTVSDVVFTVNSDGTIKANGTATADVYLTIGSYTFSAISYSLSGCPSGGGNSTFGLYASFAGGDNKMDYGSGVVFTATATTANLRIFVRNGVHIDGTFKPMLAESSSVEAYEPYENICPISGWDEVNVNVAGKNLLPNTGTSQTINNVVFTVNADGSVVANGQASANANFPIYDDNIFIPQGNYVLSMFDTDGSTTTYRTTIVARDKDNNIFVDTVSSNKSFTVSFTKAVYKLQVRFRVISGYNAQNLVCKPMLCLSTETDSTYEPYNGQTYTADLDGTRYGGTLDVTTGVLTITHGLFDLGSTNYVYSSNYGGYFYVGLVGKKAGDTNIYADCYANAGVTSVQYMADSTIKGRTADSYIFIKDSRFTDEGDLKTALNGHYAVYELATPQVVQLTAEQVMILKNQNNIWADSGEVEVTYLAQDFTGKTFHIPDLELAEGSHELTIQGTGTTTVTYTNGRL